MKTLISLLSIALWFVCYSTSLGQAGSLDPDWGSSGVVLTDFSTDRAYGRSVLIQPDGKVVVVGTTFLGGLSYDIAIARYQTNGMLDETFGSGGKATSAMGGWVGTCYGALQPDGKIVVAGTYGSAFSAMRFEADGSVDDGFGENGQVSTNISSGLLSEDVLAISLQADGKILLSGRTASGDDADMVVVRYLLNGILDPAFATGGIWIQQVSSLNDQIRAVSQQPDGKVVAFGSASVGVQPNPSRGFAMVRLNEDGTLDGVFGNNGVALITVSSGQAGVLAGVIQADGKLLATGYSGYPTLVTSIRCMPDGSLDPTFGSGGVITTYVAAESAVGKDLVIQPDGKVMVVAECWEGTGQFYSALLRYSSEGLLDEGFGTFGISTTMFADRSVVPEAIALQTDGKPILAGYSFQGSQTVFCTARHLNDVEIGVHEIGPLQLGLYAFPNPVTEHLFVQYELFEPDRISLSLIDPTGRIVLSLMNNIIRTKGTHLETLDINDLAPGHYTLFIQGSEHVGQVRLVME